VLVIAAVFAVFPTIHIGPIYDMCHFRAINILFLADAIQTYEHDHGSKPQQLSELVPHYISMGNVRVLYGPTNYPSAVNMACTTAASHRGDLGNVDIDSPYVYLGWTNNDGSVLLCEKPGAWVQYPQESRKHGKLWVIFKDYSLDMVTEQQLRKWGVGAPSGSQ
jgi:hypothetical protein